MKLNLRQGQIIYEILLSEKPITGKKLASNLSVSVRTIKYDLDDIRLWLKAKGYELQSSRNIGYWFDLNKEEADKLKMLLHMDSNYHIYSNKDNRINRIVLELSATNDYITVNQLAKMMGMSKNTIFTDLISVEERLSKNNISLNRKRNYGLKIVGEETQIRNMLENLFSERISDYQIVLIFDYLLGKTDVLDKEAYQFVKNPYLKDIFISILDIMRDLIIDGKIEEGHGSILYFLLRTTVMISRLKLGFKIREDQHEELVSNIIDSDLKSDLVGGALKKYNLLPCREELIYVRGEEIIEQNNRDSWKIVDNIIAQVSKDMEYDFSRDNRLFEDLLLYFMKSLRNGKGELINPLLEDITREFSELFDSCQRSLKKEFETLDSNTVTNRSFVSYVALHFLTSLQRSVIEENKVGVLYVCSTDPGVVNFVKERLLLRVPEVDILGFCSIREVNYYANKYEPDLVISVYPIASDKVKTITVKQIIDQMDIDRIKKMLQSIYRDRALKRENEKFPKSLIGKTIYKLSK